MLRGLLLAPPGAGKGTQGERLAADYDVPHLATGDLLRQQVESGSPIGVEASSFMDRGELVPDRLVLALVQEQVAGAPGFVLDGFPRTLIQAERAYEWGLANRRTFHAVISLQVPHDELVRRLLERAQISGRSDDTADTIVRRLRVYDEATAPLLDYYRGREILIEVDGTGAVDEVTGRIRRRLDLLDLT